MKKVMSTVIRCSGFLASLALVVATISARTNCMFFYHQPKVPHGLEKLKK